ncbi:hypothetical protein CURTO8I2_80156 [Curtobacterium sp. 8I-2]|nr:hypothetical protein CURTO8I2_80156 [Curtobacterium sp. 8I-2]
MCPRRSPCSGSGFGGPRCLLRRPCDLGRDPLPHVLRGRDQPDALGRPGHRGDPLQRGHLVAASVAGRQVLGDPVRGHLIGDREHRQRLVVDVLHSITSRRVRSRVRLRWMWLSSRSAISRWLSSSEDGSRATAVELPPASSSTSHPHYRWSTPIGCSGLLGIS